MVREFEFVVLEEDVPSAGLFRGDIGTVVLIHKESKGAEVEFVALDGETVAVVSLYEKQFRPIRHGEIAHARTVE